MPFAVWLVACEPEVEIHGRARVIDGDSLEINGTSIRLFGVDAPEGQQTCTRNGREWPCGREAAAHLRELVGYDAVRCTQKDIDQYGRSVARCRQTGTDLAAELASAGLALAYRQYSNDYVDEETQAKAARRGMWAGDFVRPWDWRRSSTASSESAPAPPTREAADCLIKGNINRQGEKIYHPPGSRNYAETIIDVSRGERWFCSEQQAQSSGWRAPRGR